VVNGAISRSNLSILRRTLSMPRSLFSFLLRFENLQIVGLMLLQGGGGFRLVRFGDFTAKWSSPNFPDRDLGDNRALRLRTNSSCADNCGSCQRVAGR
jgi:hypothetical protein